MFSFVPLDVVVIATPPAAAAPFILIPVATLEVLASTANTGLVVPLAPTASAVADVEVPVVAPETARDVKVPTDVKLDAVTLEFKVDPVSVPAAAVTVADDPREMDVPFTVKELLESLPFAIDPASMVLVTVPVSVV